MPNNKYSCPAQKHVNGKKIHNTQKSIFLSLRSKSEKEDVMKVELLLETYLSDTSQDKKKTKRFYNSPSSKLVGFIPMLMIIVEHLHNPYRIYPIG